MLVVGIVEMSVFCCVVVAGQGLENVSESYINRLTRPWRFPNMGGPWLHSKFYLLAVGDSRLTAIQSYFCSCLVHIDAIGVTQTPWDLNNQAMAMQYNSMT